MLEIAIVGGGLCGLALANGLHAQGLSWALYEARPRLGGRIQTVTAACNGLPLDMGAAWFWPDSQPRITRLVQDLGLASFPQHDTGSLLSLNDATAKPATVEVADLHGGARRLEGGSASLIRALAARLPAAALYLDHELSRLVQRPEHIELHFRRGEDVRTVAARQVVLALPPRLVEARLAFAPPLNGQLRESLRETPTWMAGHAKLGVAYGGPDGMDLQGIDRAAFWRDDGLSGNAVAGHARAVLGEVHDACDAVGARAALSAFFALDVPARAAFRSGLALLASSQLAQLFGPRAQDGEVHIQDWSEDAWTCATLDLEPPDGHPAYASRILQAPTWNGRLHFGASETAAYGGGYMEGALEAAGRLRRELLVTRAASAAGAAPCAS